MIAKPVMRGFSARHFKRDLVATVILATIFAGAFRYTVQLPRRQAYADFYKTYDAEAEFHRIRNLGYFKSAPPDEAE